MDFNALLEYGGWIVALFLASQGMLQKVIKPFVLHPLRNWLQAAPVSPATVGVWKKPWYKQLYEFLVQTSLFLAGALTVSANLHQFDIFGRWPDAAPQFARWTGLEYSAWPGALVTVLLAVLVGEVLHDYFVENELVLPVIQKRVK